MLLDTNTVYALLQDHQCATPYSLHFYDSLDSTNTFIKSLPDTHTITVCCAETQTQGRGRFGRTWHSPKAENVYCSVRWPFSGSLQQLSSLGLVIALAVVETLHALGFHQDIGIKWPNDIVWQGKKLAGILIEMQGTSAIQAIIGIGININTDTANTPLPDKEWTSLYCMGGEKIDRNKVLAMLLMQLEKHITSFTKAGLKPFLSTFARYDVLKGKNIHIMHNTRHFQGIASGIQDNGALIVKDSSGKIHHFSSGEASLKMPGNL
jgi:BirA family biotin operon repressor/biotin-[acetyl-CoA-carboxylase] ligase